MSTTPKLSEGCRFSTCQAGGVGELVQGVRQQPRKQLGQHRGLGAGVRRRHRKAQENGCLRIANTMDVT